MSIHGSFSARFRWRQEASLDMSSPHTWSISNVHIGRPCKDFCSGNGECINSICECYPGYSGVTCDVSQNNLVSCF